MSDLQVGCIYTGHLIATILTKCMRWQKYVEFSIVLRKKCLRHLLPSPSGPAAYSINICDHWTPTLRMHNAYSVPDRLDDHKHKHCITALHCTTSVYTRVHTRNGGGDRPLPRLQSSSEQSKLVCWEQRLSPLGLAQQSSIPNIMRKICPTNVM